MACSFWIIIWIIELQILDSFLDSVSNMPLDIRITFSDNLSFFEILRVVLKTYFWIASSTHRGGVFFYGSGTVYWKLVYARKNTRHASILPEDRKFRKFGASRSESFAFLQIPLGPGSPRLPGLSHAEWKRIGFLDVRIFHFGYVFHLFEYIFEYSVFLLDIQC